MTDLTAKPRNLLDRPDSFGWASIALHWLSAVLIIVMWFIGKSIHSQPADEIDAQRSLHIWIGLSAWILLAFRIGWRIWMRHPHIDGQSLRIHRFARIIHYLMLFTLSLMLISGPILALTFDSQSRLTEMSYMIHSNAANLLFALVILHILGALKHLMFHDDDTIVRMLWPKRD